VPAHTRPGLVHFALAVGGFAIGTTEFAAMSLLRYFARDLHIDEPTAGHVISSYALGAVVGAPIIAVLSAHVTRRPLLMGLMNLLSALALVFSVFGVGMTVGNLVVPRFADRALMRTAGMLLAGSALVLVIYPFAAANFWTVTADVFLLGVGGASPRYCKRG
jgi:predicted MFS family arabinose efflux permease